MGVQAIRCGTFLYRGWNRTREIQKPLVFGGVLFHISFAVERNMAAGGIHAGRGCNPQSENAQRAVEDAGPYGVRLSGCAGIRETADMGATVPLHDNRPARRRAVRGSGSGSYRRVPEPVIARHPRGAWERQRGWERKRFPMGLFASYHVRRKGIPKTMGLWRRFCILLPPWAKGCRAGARNIPTVGMKEKRCGPSGTPAPTGCVHRGAE